MLGRSFAEISSATLENHSNLLQSIDSNIAMKSIAAAPRPGFSIEDGGEYLLIRW